MAMNKETWLANLAVNTDRGPTRAIWGSCPVDSILEDPNIGVHRFEDWSDLPLTPTLTTQIAYGKYKAYATSGATIDRAGSVNSVLTPGGALKLTPSADNDAAVIGQAYPGTLTLTNSKATSGKLWFETCVAMEQIVTNNGSFFIGLGEANLFTFGATSPFNAGDPINNSGVLLGFHATEDGLGLIDTVVSDRATSYTVIGAAEGQLAASATAFGFVKLGFIYDLDAPTANRITFFSNGFPCATKYTGANIDATTNLKAASLSFLTGVVADSSGGTKSWFVKWVRWAQLYPGTSNVSL